jgi:signal transduction histidine kinase
VPTPTPNARADRQPGLEWDFTSSGFAKGAVSLAVFAALYLILVAVGLVLHETVEALTIMWPAAGLLFMALWLAPRRHWIWILSIQVTIELSAGAIKSEHFSFATYLPFVFANLLDGMVGAFVAARLISVPRVPRLRNVLLFIASVAIGAAASAVVGAFATAHTLGGPEYLREWQIWWAGNWLGSLCIAPIVMGWAVRLHARQHSAPAGSVVEMMLIAFAMLATTSWVFSAPPGGVTTILDMPFVTLVFVVIAAFRMPPRWSTVLTAVMAILVSYFASRGLGPFAGDSNPFVRVGAVQLYLATLVVINFLLTVVLLEKRNAFQLLRTSDERYVTELVELNERLRQNQERLKLFARELVGAEERARRATAVDLHDGIGQQLVGLAMTLSALAARSPPEIRLPLGEATNTVREVQAIAQRVIADLSPPGLYELGLEPALKWLSVYMRGKDNLQVDLHVAADQSGIDIDLRVLVFKVIRELLRNVVKHSGVQSATVTVTRNTDELRVVVEDRGVGFEWQLSLFEPPQHGFGLWSVVDRVREAAGEMTVDTGPGRGCRVTVVFPLGFAKLPIQQTNPGSESRDMGPARSASM